MRDYYIERKSVFLIFILHRIFEKLSHKQCDWILSTALGTFVKHELKGVLRYKGRNLDPPQTVTDTFNY